jgi:hypothetical protein
MTDQAQVDWTISYVRRHANDDKWPTVEVYQPSLYDVLGSEDDHDDQEEP